MNINGYLKKIEAGEPINFSRLLSLLPSSLQNNYRAYFSFELVSPQRWIVQCDESVINELKTIAEIPSNRIAAAVKGDSHKVAVSYGYVLIYHEGIKDSRPEVVYFESEAFIQPHSPKTNLILIENEENFFRWRDMLTVFNKMSDYNYSIENTDICLGSGNRCSSPLLVSWLTQYESILCAFDYDAKGLEMYQSLNTKLGNKVKFFMPEAFEALSSLFRMKPKDIKQLNKAVVLAHKMKFDRLADTFMSTRRFMEQESLLMEYEDESTTD